MKIDVTPIGPNVSINRGDLILTDMGAAYLAISVGNDLNLIRVSDGEQIKSPNMLSYSGMKDGKVSDYLKRAHGEVILEVIAWKDLVLSRRA